VSCERLHLGLATNAEIDVPSKPIYVFEASKDFSPNTFKEIETIKEEKVKVVEQPIVKEIVIPIVKEIVKPIVQPIVKPKVRDSILLP